MIAISRNSQEKVEWRKGWHSFEVSKVYMGIGTSFVFGTLALCFQLFKVSSTNSCTLTKHIQIPSRVFSQTTLYLMDGYKWTQFIEQSPS